MKRLIALLLALVMVLALAACAPQQNETKPSSGNNPKPSQGDTQPSGGEDPADPYKLSDEKVTLKVFMPHTDANRAAMGDDPNASPVVQKLEELTNVHIEFICPPAGDDGSFFNLMLMSPEEWPDIFIYDFKANYDGGILQAIDDGIIINHQQLLEKYGQNILALAETNKDMYDTDLRWLENGMLNIFEYAEPCMQNKATYGTVMRKDWLDECGLAVPTTYAEFEAACEAIMKKHPEVKYGMAVAGLNSWWVGRQSFYTAGYGFPNNWIEPMVGADGKVTASPLTTGYGEWLEMMNRWSNKGIWHPDNWTFDDDACRNALITGQAIATTSAMWRVDQDVELGKASDPNFELVPVPVLRKDGDTSTLHFTDVGTHTNNGFANYYISTTSKNQELAMKWINVLHEQEICDMLMFGVGVEMDGKELGVIGEDGLATYADWVWEDLTDVRDAFYIQRLVMSYGDGAHARDSELYWEVMDVWSQNVDGDGLIDEIYTASQAETEAYKPIYDNVRSILKDYVKKIILGERPVSDWDKALEEMQKVGIDEYVEIWQGVYDRGRN